MENLGNLLYIGIGAFLGGMGRLFLGQIFNRGKEAFPLGTFLANALGSLLIGIMAGWGLNYYVNPQYHLLLATGFCGALTTFSTFSLENIRLYHKEKFMIFAGYIFTSGVLCLGAVLGGMYLGGKL